MKIPCLLAASLLIPSGAALAHPREDALRSMAEYNVRHPAKLAMAMTDAEPRVRIRGDDGNGLKQRGFTRWISRHPAVIDTRRADGSMWILASSAPPAQIGAFALADRNHDGRVSATELADFLSGPSAALPL